MKVFPISTRRWFLQLAIVCVSVRSGLTVAADSSTVPEQLQGRRSDWIQEKPFLTKSEISAKLKRPRNVRELLENLYVAWIDRLLVEPSFYDNSILMTFFNGTVVTWKDRRVDPMAENSNRVVEVKLDSRVFPRAVATVRLYREKVGATNKSQPYFPAHQHYMGYFDLSVKGVNDFTWKEVTRIFGSNATSLPLTSLAGPGLEAPSSVALMRYSYPGDDPTKFGEVTLPQTRFWLEGWRPDVPSSEKEGPRESDTVMRIFMLEAINRARGEE